MNTYLFNKSMMKDPAIFNKHNFLPENFEKLLKKIRSSPEERLKRFGLIN